MVHAELYLHQWIVNRVNDTDRVKTVSPTATERSQVCSKIISIAPANPI
jgi:hypothetical protein